MKDLVNNIAYEKAKKRMKDEKGFYIHLIVYVIINVATAIFRGEFIDFIEPHIINNDTFTKYTDSHIHISPTLWGVGLAIHGIRVFKRHLFKNNLVKNSIFSKEWEEQKIKELMHNDNF